MCLARFLLEENTEGHVDESLVDENYRVWKAKARTNVDQFLRDNPSCVGKTWPVLYEENHNLCEQQVLILEAQLRSYGIHRRINKWAGHRLMSEAVRNKCTQFKKKYPLTGSEHDATLGADEELNSTGDINSSIAAAASHAHSTDYDEDPLREEDAEPIYCYDMNYNEDANTDDEDSPPWRCYDKDEDEHIFGDEGEDIDDEKDEDGDGGDDSECDEDDQQEQQQVIGSSTMGTTCHDNVQFKMSTAASSAIGAGITNTNKAKTIFKGPNVFTDEALFNGTSSPSASFSIG